MNAVVAAGPVIPNFGQGSKCEQTNGWWCTDWLHAHWGDTLQPALFQHIELSLIAVSIGFALAFLLALVGVIDTETGVWALFDPRGWYDKFPGFGHHWVSGQGGTYNEHLVSDAGAGFLAVGLLLLVGAAIGSSVAMRLAALALLAHALPHFLFHVANSPEHLSDGDKAAGTYGLLAEAVIGFFALVGARSRH